MCLLKLFVQLYIFVQNSNLYSVCVRALNSLQLLTDHFGFLSGPNLPQCSVALLFKIKYSLSEIFLWNWTYLYFPEVFYIPMICSHWHWYSIKKPSVKVKEILFFKNCSDLSLEQFFLTVAQNNFSKQNIIVIWTNMFLLFYSD